MYKIIRALLAQSPESQPLLAPNLTGNEVTPDQPLSPVSPTLSLNDLPNEIVLAIFKYLSMQSLYRFSTTNKNNYHLVLDLSKYIDKMEILTLNFGSNKIRFHGTFNALTTIYNHPCSKEARKNKDIKILEKKTKAEHQQATINKTATGLIVFGSLGSFATGVITSASIGNCVPCVASLALVGLFNCSGYTLGKVSQVYCGNRISTLNQEFHEQRRKDYENGKKLLSEFPPQAIQMNHS